MLYYIRCLARSPGLPSVDQTFLSILTSKEANAKMPRSLETNQMARQLLTAFSTHTHTPYSVRTMKHFLPEYSSPCF